MPVNSYPPSVPSAIHGEPCAATFMLSQSSIATSALGVGSTTTAGFWRYVAANWSNVKGFVLEVTGEAQNNTAYFQLYDMTSSTAVGTSVSTTVNNANARLRSTIMLPNTFTDGHDYALSWWSSTSGQSAFLAFAALKVVI